MTSDVTISHTTGTPSVLDLDDATDPDRAGRKAATLARLRRAGLPVPPGVVVLPEADPATAAAVVADHLGDRPLAVRSSSVAEDLGGASYAGQYATVLDVRGPDAIRAAVAEVRASAADPADRGYDGADAAPMAVLVMPMVDAAAAGVAFTVDPVTGADRTVIEATTGLGDRLVDGAVDPDRWIVDTDGRPRHDSDENALTRDEAADVAALAERIAELEGRPQDVEWAIVDGRVVLLQARPVTAVAVEPDIDAPEGQTWVREDDHFTGPTTPLEASVWMPRIERASREAAAQAGLPIDAICYHRTAGGWIYMRLAPVGDRGTDGPPPPAPVMGLLSRLLPPLRERMRAAAAAHERGVAAEAIAWWEDGARDRLRGRIRALREVDRGRLDDAALADHLTDVLALITRAAQAHFRLAFQATILTTGRLGMAATELLGWEPPRVMDLLAGHSAASAQRGRALDEVAAAVRGDEQARRLLAEDPQALVDHDGPGGAALRDYLDSWGHALVELDLRQPSYAEEPAPLLSMLRSLIDRTGAPGAPGERSVADDAEDRARAQLDGRPADLRRFGELLERARRAQPFRDESEWDVAAAWAVLRYTVVEAGRRLADDGVIPRARDVHLLTADELGDGLRTGSRPDGLARRRGELRWAETHRPPKVLGPPPADPPDFSWIPRSARPIVLPFMWAAGTLEGAADGDGGDDPAGLRGLAASPGRTTATARVIRSPREFDRLEPGDVMVCPCTLASWSVAFPIIGGLVTEHGGPLSHPAVVAREFDIPAVVGVPGVMDAVEDGARVTVDGAGGRVRVHP